MSATQSNRIVCEGCGRSGPYRPELAGKKIKCKCGHVMRVPEATPPEPEPIHQDEPLSPEPLPDENSGLESLAPEELDALYDIREDPQPAKPARKIPPAAVSAAGPNQRQSAGPPTRAPEPLLYQSVSKPRPQVDNAAAEKARLIKMLVLLIIVGGIIGGAFYGLKKLNTPKITGPQLGEDATVEGMMEDQYNKEVHDWFAEDHSRMMGSWSETQALAQADRWKQMGAKRVIAFSSRLSTVAVIELPDDPALRKPIFDWQAQWHEQHMEKVWTDVGQKYLMIRLGF
jgi:hypothetical protein